MRLQSDVLKQQILLVRSQRLAKQLSHVAEAHLVDGLSQPLDVGAASEPALEVLAEGVQVVALDDCEKLLTRSSIERVGS